MSAFSDFGVPGLILCRPIDAYDANNQGVSADITIEYGPKEFYTVSTSHYISGSQVIVNYTATAKAWYYDPYTTSGSFVVS